MSQDDQATHLVELEIKRNRTLADLDTVQEARRSARLTIESYLPKPEEIITQYASALERDDLPEERRQQLYDEWNKFLAETSDEFQELVEEYERLQLQEKILTRMMGEIDRQIEEVKDALM